MFKREVEKMLEEKLKVYFFRKRRGTMLKRKIEKKLKGKRKALSFIEM